ncbi:Nickel-binding periplasmic protein [Colletotrichum sidae]|uniref:Nickel-binding periplasmic protein n=1 Tax=Colletotrichum sidae TaxID=1347389 RepID=A0A4R8TIF6_9PEZI|nr:Nickel-binding periplasmic protein [Colletotrichum sidae]
MGFLTTTKLICQSENGVIPDLLLTRSFGPVSKGAVDAVGKPAGIVRWCRCRTTATETIGWPPMEHRDWLPGSPRNVVIKLRSFAFLAPVDDIPQVGSWLNQVNEVDVSTVNVRSINALNMTPEVLRLSLENVDFRLPTQVTDDHSVTALKSLVFEPLLRWQPHGRVLPGLFDRWDHSADGKIWAFHIRDDAVFHDGKPCVAEDVVAYILGLLDSRDYFGMRWSYSRYFAGADITAVDGRTVQVENPEPFAHILDIFCEFWPVRNDAGGKPVLGTGPFRVVEFERADNIGKATLQRVNVSRHSTPHVIVANHEPNAAKRLEQLRKGEVDAALNLERVEDLGLLTFDPTLRWGRVTSTLSAIYYLNCTDGIFASPDARLAANLAVDNEALVREVYKGFALPSATIVSPFHLGFPESQLEPIPHDPARAKQLLEGLDTSTPLVLRTPVYMPEHAQKISEFVAAALRDVGFQVEVKVETNRPGYARQIGLHKQIGSLALFDSTPNSTFRVVDDKISSSSHATWWLGYHDDEVQRLFTEARGKIDRDERAEAYAVVLKRLQENPPWLYVGHPEVVWATNLTTALRIGHSGILALED